MEAYGIHGTPTATRPAVQTQQALLRYGGQQAEAAELSDL